MATASVAFSVPATALALRPHVRRVNRTAARTVPTSRASSGTERIGALYASASTPVHNCTASVVASARGNLLITAAHCVSGSGQGMVFAPAQHGGQTPYGRWTVTSAYLAPAWVSEQNPDDDVAFLTVAPQTINGKLTEIQQVTGAYRLGPGAKRGQRVTISGYPAGTSNNPITCTVSIYLTHEFPTFDCHGFVNGTSGSPWVYETEHGPQIVGVIGGRNQGGCFEYRSYSSPLKGLLETYHRAMAGAPADTAPAPRGDGC